MTLPVVRQRPLCDVPAARPPIKPRNDQGRAISNAAANRGRADDYADDYTDGGGVAKGGADKSLSHRPFRRKSSYRAPKPSLGARDQAELLGRRWEWD